MLLIGIALSADVAEAARKERLELRYQAIELPGAPSTILPADLNGDGRQDLIVVVAYTEWDQIGVEESTEMDGIDGLVEVLTIVPSLFDRRELRVFLARGDGYQGLPAIPLDPTVLSLDLGPTDQPIIALTDDGLSALRLDGEQVTLEPILRGRPVLARSATFVPDLGLAHDLDNDDQRDLLFPAAEGAVVYLGASGALTTTPAAHLLWPAVEDTDNRSRRRLSHHYPLPEVRDVDGDGLPDLLLLDEDSTWEPFYVLRNLGDGRFADPQILGEENAEEIDSESQEGEDDEEEAAPKEPSLAYFGDLDGDGIAEYVMQQELAEDDAGMRQEMREAKQPPFRYRLHRSKSDLTRIEEPYVEFEAIGYAFDDGEEDEAKLSGGFQDLDGDGRSDLVTLTLDFSLMQAVRVLTTRRISIGIDFHVWCQEDDGSFRPVRGLDLSGKFRLDLDDLRIGQMSQFAGDFDNDGKADFVQMGRGRDVTIHRGRQGCVYPPAPDLKLQLKEEPKDLQLVRVDDFNGDDRTDLIVIQPQKITEPGVTPPVRLDLYFSSRAETKNSSGGGR